MNRQIRTNLLLAALATSAGIVSAQTTPKKNLPEPPFVGALNPTIQWKASVEAKTKRSDPATPEEAKLFARRDRLSPQLEAITGYKADQGLHLIYQWKGNKKTEAYVIDGILFIERNPNFPNSIGVQDPSADPSYPNYSKSDFPELTWVGSRTFVETTIEQGRRCYLYQLRESDLAVESSTPEPRENADAPSSTVVLQQAWIDVDSRLPSKFDDGKNIYTYSYFKVTPTKITIPSAFQKWVDEVRRCKDPIQ